MTMRNQEPFFPQPDGFSTVNQGPGSSAIRALATQDHAVIRQWAARHHAEPATEDDTTSAAPTLKVTDGGTLVRFNFPAAARFGPVTWEKWFEHFDRLGLTFVHEEDIADRAFELWHARGETHGHDRADWLEAEHRLEGPAGPPSARYRFMPQEEERQEKKP
jgi:hypothetical protein